MFKISAAPGFRYYNINLFILVTSKSLTSTEERCMNISAGKNTLST